MQKEFLNILIVEDCEDDALLVARQFRVAGYQVAVKRVETAQDMAAALRDGGWDAIIADVTMPHFCASEALGIYSQYDCDCPFIVVSGTIGEETAVGLLKAGAHDFLPKTNLSRLVPATERELRETDGRRARRHAEEALRASEERYALAAAGSNDGLWDWNLKTNRVYFSPRWAKMLGLAPDCIPDSPGTWFGRIHDDDAAAVRRGLDDHLAGRAPHFAMEYRMRHRDGQWRWMLARGLAVVDERGVPCRIAGSQTDISAHKQAEQQLRRAKDELEHAIAAKTRFLAAASHDLRQPVQALLCFSSLLEMQLQDHPAMATVKDVAGALESLKSLLDAILDVSRLDAGVIKPALCDFAVGTVLAQVAAEMRPLAEAEGLRLRLVGSAHQVRSDPVLLGRILRNFVENAIRYTHHGSILIGCRRRGGAVSVMVCDSGIGIDTESRSHIFEEFFQVANPERDRMKGLGLGLAIVARLSRLLGHDIVLHSTVGRGSTFSVSVPTAIAHQAMPPPTLELAAPHPSRGTILVIDDEAVVAAAFGTLLNAWGFETLVASSLEEATAMLRRPPSAIVADYRLRDGRTGIEAVSALRSLFTSHIPCVVVTGDTAVERLREISESGSMLLHKPVTAAELRRAIHSLLSAAGADAAGQRAAVH